MKSYHVVAFNVVFHSVSFGVRLQRYCEQIVIMLVQAFLLYLSYIVIKSRYAAGSTIGYRSSLGSHNLGKWFDGPH